MLSVQLRWTRKSSGDNYEFFSSYGATARHTIIAVGDQALLSATNFLTGLLLARLTDFVTYGAYVLCYSVMLLANGIQTALVTGPIPIIGARKSESEQRDYFSDLFLGQLVSGFLLTVVMLGVGAVVTSLGVVDREFGRVFFSMGVSLQFIQFQEFFRRLFFSRMDVVRVLVMDVLYVFLQCVGLLLFWLVPGGSWSPAHAGMLNGVTVFRWLGVSALLSASFGFYRFRRAHWWKQSELRKTLAEHWAFGRWGLAGSLASYGGNQLVPFIIGAIVGLKGAAIYESSRLISGPVQVIQMGVVSVMAVQVADLYTSVSPKNAKHLTRVVTLAGAIVFALYFFTFYFFSSEIIGISVGMKYSDLTFEMLLFGLFYVVLWIANMQSCYLNAAKMPEANFWAVFWGMTASLPLSILGVCYFGVPGGIGAIICGQTVGVVLRGLRTREVLV